MRKAVILCVLAIFLALPVCATEEVSIVDTSPIYEVPESAREYLPEEGTSLPEGLGALFWQVLSKIQPSLTEAVGTCAAVLCAVLLCTVFQTPELSTRRNTADLVGTLGITALILGRTASQIGLCKATIVELSEYGKLLLPVMASAMAASGAPTTSSALYFGTAVFDGILMAAVTGLLVPMVYAHIMASFANSAVGHELLQKIRELIAWACNWGLKLLLSIFTGYMSLTGVLSGTADAAAVKATKTTISTAVPVIGNILAGASDLVVLSASAVKSAAGVYGLLAVLAICAGPFCQIGVQYLMLKLTWALCGITGNKRLTELVGNFAQAMGLLLAMVGVCCLMLLISLACFMKGAGYT